MAHAVDILRTGAWLTGERVKLVVFGLLAAEFIAAVYVVATSDGLNDRFGRPLGTDFSNVYAAGTYVLDGNAAAPFDPPRGIRARAGDLRRRHAVLRLALPAVLSWPRRAVRRHALRAGARALAGCHIRSLSLGDVGNSEHGTSPRAGRTRYGFRSSSVSRRFSSISVMAIMASCQRDCRLCAAAARSEAVLAGVLFGCMACSSRKSGSECSPLCSRQADGGEPLSQRPRPSQR